MAQRDMKPTTNKERPSSMKLQTSLSEPYPSNQPTSNTHRHLTLPSPSNNNYSQSPAERYISSRSQMLLNSNDQQDISPETPTLITTNTMHSYQPIMSHTELMNKWYQKKTNEISKKHKHRYVYGTTSSSSSVTSPTALGFPFPLSTQLSQRNGSQSSTRTLKKS